jgi:preprotein translocase subunit SecB
MEIQKSAKELKSLAKVVARTDLKSLSLLNSDAWRSLDALDHPRVSAEIRMEGILLQEEEDCILAKAIFSFAGTPVDENETKSEQQVVSIKAEYLLVYSLPNKTDLSKEELENFCSINAMYNAWPYWREFIQTLSNKMGLPPMTLPLLKFRQARKNGGKEEGRKAKKAEGPSVDEQQ